MSPRRRAAIWILRGALGLTLLVTAVVLHLPGPSGVSGAAQEDVRGVWQMAGRVGHAVASHLPDIPDFLGPLFSDKTIHLGLFVALSFLWASARALGRSLDRRGAWIVFGGLALYAGVGEWAQGLEGRIADPWDWVANLVGAAIGTVAVGLGAAAVRAQRKTAARNLRTAASRENPER